MTVLDRQPFSANMLQIVLLLIINGCDFFKRFQGCSHDIITFFALNIDR
jgi:hypothetical protein